MVLFTSLPKTCFSTHDLQLTLILELYHHTTLILRNKWCINFGIISDMSRFLPHYAPSFLNTSMCLLPLSPSQSNTTVDCIVAKWGLWMVGSVCLDWNLTVTYNLCELEQITCFYICKMRKRIIPILQSSCRLNESILAKGLKIVPDPQKTIQKCQLILYFSCRN